VALTGCAGGGFSETLEGCPDPDQALLGEMPPCVGRHVAVLDDGRNPVGQVNQAAHRDERSLEDENARFLR